MDNHQIIFFLRGRDVKSWRIRCLDLRKMATFSSWPAKVWLIGAEDEGFCSCPSDWTLCSRRTSEIFLSSRLVSAMSRRVHHTSVSDSHLGYWENNDNNNREKKRNTQKWSASWKDRAIVENPDSCDHVIYFFTHIFCICRFRKCFLGGRGGKKTANSRTISLWSRTAVTLSLAFFPPSEKTVSWSFALVGEI